MDTTILHLITHRFPSATAEVHRKENVALIQFEYPGLKDDEPVMLRTKSYMAVNARGIAVERHALLVGKERLTDEIVKIFIDYKNNLNEEKDSI